MVVSGVPVEDISARIHLRKLLTNRALLFHCVKNCVVERRTSRYGSAKVVDMANFTSGSRQTEREYAFSALQFRILLDLTEPAGRPNNAKHLQMRL